MQFLKLVFLAAEMDSLEMVLICLVECSWICLGQIRIDQSPSHQRTEELKMQSFFNLQQPLQIHIVCNNGVRPAWAARSVKEKKKTNRGRRLE